MENTIFLSKVLNIKNENERKKLDITKLRDSSVIIDIQNSDLLELLNDCQNEIDLALSLIIITSTEFEKNQSSLLQSHFT